MRPAGIIAQRIHLGAVGADLMQQIRQRHIGTVFLDQCCLPVLAGSVALPAFKLQHGGWVLGEAERTIGHGVMLLAGAGIPNTYRPR